MSRIYTLQEKRHAIWLIEQLASITAVSEQLHIPERTLRDWLRAYNRGDFRAVRNPLDQYQGKSGTITADQLRDRLLDQLDTLTRETSSDPRKAYFTSLAVDRLLAHIKMLNEVIGIPPITTDPDQPFSPDTEENRSP